MDLPADQAAHRTRMPLPNHRDPPNGWRRTGRKVSMKAHNNQSGFPGRRGSGGFTLLELMIVVVIAAILSSIALPAYQERMRDTYRSSAKQWLVEIAGVQAQYLMDARNYGSLATIGMNAPPDPVGRFYDISLAANVNCAGSAATPGYCLSAIPKTDTLQAGDPVLKLDHLGRRLPADQWD